MIDCRIAEGEIIRAQGMERKMGMHKFSHLTRKYEMLNEVGQVSCLDVYPKWFSELIWSPGMASASQSNLQIT